MCSRVNLTASPPSDSGAIHVMAAGSGVSRMTGTIVSRSYLGPVIRLLIDLKRT